MPAPHTHPSVHCYKHHRCRCDGCRTITMAWQREWRRRRQAVDWVSQRETKARRLARVNPLGEDELMRLRRAVGLI